MLAASAGPEGAGKGLVTSGAQCASSYARVLGLPREALSELKWGESCVLCVLSAPGAGEWPLEGILCAGLTLSCLLPCFSWAPLGGGERV